MPAEAGSGDVDGCGRWFGRVITVLGRLARLGMAEVRGRTPRMARLSLVSSDQPGTDAWLDELLLEAWRRHFGQV